MSVTELSKDYVNKIVDDLLRKYDLAFDGEFEAFTPWWGGNEFGYVFYPEPHYPEPKAIIGRVKWAIRTMLGEVPKELGEIPRETSQKSKEAQGGASVVKVLVSVERGGEPYFIKDELDRIEKVIENLTKDVKGTVRGKKPGAVDERKTYMKALAAMSEVGYEMLFDGYKSGNKSANDFRGVKSDLYKLLAIPRFYLKALGRRGQKPVEVLRGLYKAQPMRPGFRIRVMVLSRDKKIARLFITAMLITMKYLGIGGAANRGFGRFRLVKIIDGSVIKDINTDIDITRNDIYAELRKMGFEPKIDPRKRDPLFPRFPLPSEVRVVRGPVSAFINGRKYRARDIEGVLAAIGIATLKSTWKSYLYTTCKDLKGSGREYHTWVLGLPRTGYSARGSGRRQSYIVISPTEDLGALLIPFYANDYPGIAHRTKEVTTARRMAPNCRSLGPSSSVRDHVDLALEWLKTLLG